MKDDKLYLITVNKKGLGYKTILYVVNLNNGSVENKEIESSHSGPKWITMPAQTIWFGKNYLVPFIMEKSSIRLKLSSDLVSQDYEK